MQKDILFLKACQNGQKGVVTSFLKSGNINVNCKDNDGLTPLHFACKKPAKEIVKILLDNEADVYATTNKGITPLHFAATSGNKDIIKMLVEKDADINATDNEGRSVMIYGINAGKTDAVKYIIELGGDVTIADNEGRTAADYANINGQVQIIELAVSGDENKKDSFGNTPLHQSCYNGHSEVVKKMLESGNIEVDALNDVGETPLNIAVSNGNLYIAELLIKAGADVNKKDDSGDGLLHIAARSRKTHLVSMLVKNGAVVDDRNKYGETALICAVKPNGMYSKGSLEIVKYLLEAGAEVGHKDIREKTALFYAIEDNNQGIIEALLEAGAEE